MTHEERYYDTKWRYDNHFKDDEMKGELINDSYHYIQDLESRVYELESELEEFTTEEWE
ncbi:hypothetical protein [Staphylococcus felis]|uniref:hypothetical protein n=1 Tax=Staphylococcus felis TaxID=46127 RepID=UPI0015F25349|nr:hypothetical protein [Staphylococcus felis]